MFSSTIKASNQAALYSAVFTGLLLTACQTTHDGQADSGNVRSETINFRSDLHYASSPNAEPKIKSQVVPEIEREVTGEESSLFVRKHRVLIPIKHSGQKQLDDMDSYLRPLMKTLLAWDSVHRVIVREVKVVGHTDSEGSELSNMLLSLGRANAVADRLEELGVEAGLLRIEAYGETRPVGDNTSMDGRIANRRVEIVVTGYPESPVSGDPLLATHDASDGL